MISLNARGIAARTRSEESELPAFEAVAKQIKLIVEESMGPLGLLESIREDLYESAHTYKHFFLGGGVWFRGG